MAKPPIIDDAETASTPQPQIFFVGQSDKVLWGLPIAEWQRRAYWKSAPLGTPTTVTADMRWVLSAALLQAFMASKNTALMKDGQIIAVNGIDAKAASTLMSASPAQMKTQAKALGIDLVNVDDMPVGYIQSLRKTEKPYALDIESVPVIDIEKRQFASSYKGVTDFVTKFFWPRPAFHATRFCANHRISPNTVTTLSLVMVFIAMFFFARGQWLPGFITGWFMTFLDTVDGKLARTTMSYSNWGNIYDHGIDLIHPPFWYAAWFAGLGGAFSDYSVLRFALFAILVGYIVDRIIEGLFIRAFGFHIHVWKPYNSFLRFIIARRNPNMFIFMVGIIVATAFPLAGEGGFYAVAIWVWLSILSCTISLTAACLSKQPVTSWMDSPDADFFDVQGNI